MRNKSYLFILLACSGCMTYWTKPGGTEDEYNKDSYECERDSRQSGYFGTGIAGALSQREFFKHCMRAHGYREKEPPPSTDGPIKDNNSTPDYPAQNQRN